MSHYLSTLGGRVLATALFTGALFLGFVPPTAAGEFILWAGVFTADGGCKVTAVDQSADILLFSGPLPGPPADTCSGIKAAIQKAPLRTGTPTPPETCEQQPTQSHIVTVPPPGQDPSFDKLFRGPVEFLEEELKGRVFRISVTGEAQCEFPPPQ